LGGSVPDTGYKSDEHFMRMAIEVATERGSDPDLSPIGCVIVLDGRIVATERNHVAEKHDSTAHAEIEAIRAAGRSFNDGELRGAVLYTTLQPCGMCTMASIWSKVGRIVYGAGRDDVHPMYFEARHVNTLDFVADAFREDIEIVGGVLRSECAELYYRPWDDVPEAKQGNK
jgi:tRNA(adenine34) deaminase